MAFFTPCQSCNRHVLSSDSHCPFCSAEVTQAMRARTPVLPRKRLGRAAMMAFGATIVSGTASCGGEEDTGSAREPASSSPVDMNTTGDPSPSPDADGMTSIGTEPSPTPGTMTSDDTDDEPMAIAEYGVPALPPEPEPNTAMGGAPPIPPGAGGDYGAGGTAKPDFTPEPDITVMPAYGLPALEPEPPTQVEPEPSEPEPRSDAGTFDAAVDPIDEPEPLAVAEYGVPPLDLE